MDGVLKDRQTYEIMLPEDVGFEKSHVVLTARTGRAGLRDRLEKLRYNLTSVDFRVPEFAFEYLRRKSLSASDRSDDQENVRRL